MKDVDELAGLERRLLDLQREAHARVAAVEAACRARLASPAALVTAGVVGALLGTLGGHRGRPPNAGNEAPHASEHGNAWFGALLTLAGAAGALVRILELGTLFKLFKSTTQEP